MTMRIIPVQPFDYVVFGGTGDLSRRKLLPALYARFVDGQYNETSRIIGVSRTPMSVDAYRNMAADAIRKHAPKPSIDEDHLRRFLGCVLYSCNDVTSSDGWDDLRTVLAAGQAQVRAYYLAVAPSLFGPICRYLAQGGFATPHARLVLEKPIGRDLKTAREINDAVGEMFDEHQIYRIDHYLGKETVQNLMALRFANALFEPIWRSGHIDHVQITVAEALGVGDRAGYYDTAGAMRDMVQNHLLQLLCLVAMEPPAAFEADAVRDEKLKVLQALVPIDQTNAHQLTIRGQYRGIAAGDVSVPGYLEELDDELASHTETFVAIKAQVNNWRWAGVPFYLRTGKRMAGRFSEIVVQFKDIPHSIFPQAAGRLDSNQLVLRLQPNEGVKLFVMIKDPGPGGMRFRRVPLNLAFAEAFVGDPPDAYERLLLDVVRGDQTLFMRRDEVDAAWRWIDPIRAAWDKFNERPQGYTVGSWGPSGSIALIERDGRTWHEPDTE